MNARAEREFRQRKVLSDAGWSVPKRDSVAFNSGSESLPHWIAKCLVAYEMKSRGFRIASEVPKDNVGEIDIVAYGTEDPPVAIEVETNPTEEVVESKLSRYVHGEPYRDMLLVPVEDMPENVFEAREWARGKL